MRKTKKAVACLVAVLLTLSTFPLAFTASAAQSGVCGDDVAWSIENGVLTISGNGAMYDYPPGSNNTPWQLSEEPYDTIIINYGVTHIGAWAFAFSSVTHIMIPNSVMTIGEDAFASITGLTNVTIPSSVTSWPEAFVLCNDLMNVTIEPGVTLIDRMSFGGCANLHYVGIPDSVTTIGQAAFNLCTGLGLITLPSNLETIGPSAFAGSGLLFVELPDSVTTIGMEAFAGAPLAAVTLPSNLTAIEPEAFAGTALTSIEFPASVTYIGQRAFAGSSLTSVTLPSQLMDIREEVFRDCTELSHVSIPDSLIFIGGNAFSGCTSLQSIHIPATVQSISEGAFLDCDSLSLILSSSTNTAAYDYATAHNIPFALYGSDNACGDDLTWSLENGVLTITGLGAMYDYGTAEHAAAPWAGETITQISFPSGITHVGDNAFGGCTTITEVFGPSSLRSNGGSYSATIGVNNAPLHRAVWRYSDFGLIDSGFFGDNLIWRFIENRVGTEVCYGTLYIYGTGAMPDYSFTSVGPGGIYDVTTAPWKDFSFQIEEVVIDSGVTNIGACAFYGCDALTSVTVPDTVTSIGASAFYKCTALTSVDLSDSAITSIGASAFFRCTALTSVDLSDSAITSIGASAFFRCTALTSVDLGDSVTSIGDYTFYGCDALTSVTMSDTVTSIGSFAFSNCIELTSITIPAGVVSIGGYAFELCNKLTVINFNAVALPEYGMSYSVFSSAGRFGSGITLTFGDAVEYVPNNIFGANEGFAPNITAVRFGSSMARIGDSAFKNCTTITDVYYDGTQRQWDAVSIGTNNDPLTNATLHCAALPANACGDHLTWSIENGVLTISGAGEMYDFCNPYDTENSSRAPWADELYDEVVIGCGVTSIGSDAFNSVSLESSLTTVTISDTVTSIGNEAFLNCRNLAGVVIPDSITTIGERAFLDCTAMSTLTLGSSVKEIKIGAFASCSSLSSVVIPDSVQTIGVSAFEGCSGLTSLTIGSGVTSLGATAFAGCEALTEINYNVPNLADLTNEHGVFGAGTPVNTPVTVTFGDNVQHVPAYLFDRFEPGEGPQITTVYFGNALTSVGQKAFEKCTSITDVYYDGTQTQWDALTIGSNNEPLLAATLHCTENAPNDEYSVSVNDQVALNLMLDLEARGVTTDAVSVTLNGQPCEYDVVQDGDQYRFSIVTAPAQLADPILVTAGGETLAETSVMDYCLALCGSEYDEYPEAQALARALLQYGKAANDVFDYTDAEITTLDTLDTAPVAAYTGAKFSDGTHKVSGASFLALTKPVFRFYMNSLTEAQAYAYNQAGVSAAYADETVGEALHARFVKRQVNGEAVMLVEVTGVSVENMEEEILVTVNGLGTIRFNGNAFAKAMANDADQVTQRFGAALYNYSVAAKACFKEEQP